MIIYIRPHAANKLGKNQPQRSKFAFFRITTQTQFFIMIQNNVYLTHHEHSRAMYTCVPYAKLAKKLYFTVENIQFRIILCTLALVVSSESSSFLTFWARPKSVILTLFCDCMSTLRAARSL